MKYIREESFMGWTELKESEMYVTIEDIGWDPIHFGPDPSRLDITVIIRSCQASQWLETTP